MKYKNIALMVVFVRRANDVQKSFRNALRNEHREARVNPDPINIGHFPDIIEEKFDFLFGQAHRVRAAENQFGERSVRRKRGKQRSEPFFDRFEAPSGAKKSGTNGKMAPKAESAVPRANAAG